MVMKVYPNGPKFLDRQTLANSQCRPSAGGLLLEERSDHGHHCLQSSLPLHESLLCGKI